MARNSSTENRPFHVLKKMVTRGELELHPETDKPIAPPRGVNSALSDQEAFAAEMANVEPLGWSETPLELPPPCEIPTWAGDAIDEVEVEAEAAALGELQAFVDGRGEMDPFLMGEGVEGAASTAARRFLPRLKNGDFSVQEHLDLHGFGLDDAKVLLEQFLKQAQHRSLSCVRIVHGRGKHSPSEPHAMKRAVIQWLTSRRLRRTVVAFASARWNDGGSGALYVLLFRQGGASRGDNGRQRRGGATQLVT